MQDTRVIEALLGREDRSIDAIGMASHVEGQRVLVTGAGGSIGRELARQCATFGCAHLSLLDNSAPALFEVDGLIGDLAPELSRQEILCDVRDSGLVAGWVERERPDIILHAAAIKHVNLVERHVCEGALTNLVGARNVAEAGAAIGATVTLISTDKAAQPLSAMGKTKRLAEWATLDLDHADAHGRFAAVRFGNVFGSSGSVACIFRSQIERGGPVTVTDPAMERFFMTVGEAVRLVLAATTLRAERGRAKASMFTLEMGRPIRIIDLARQMIAAYADQPEAVEIKIIGSRPGESLTERLVDDDETITGTPIHGVRELGLRKARPPLEKARIDEIERLARRGDDAAVLQLMDEALEIGRPIDLPMTA